MGQSNNGNRSTRHHLIPRSRGGSNGKNILVIPQRIHEAYHILFGNLTPQEALKFLKIVFLGEGRRKMKKSWKIEELTQLQIQIQLETYEYEKEKRKGEKNKKNIKLKKRPRAAFFKGISHFLTYAMK